MNAIEVFETVKEAMQSAEEIGLYEEDYITLMANIIKEASTRILNLTEMISPCETEKHPY